MIPTRFMILSYLARGESYQAEISAETQAVNVSKVLGLMAKEEQPLIELDPTPRPERGVHPGRDRKYYRITERGDQARRYYFGKLLEWSGIKGEVLALNAILATLDTGKGDYRGGGRAVCKDVLKILDAAGSEK